jgi:signal transduction histidine kinase
MGYVGYLATLIVSVIISGILAIFFWLRRPAPGATALAGLLCVSLIWSLGYMVEATSTTLSGFQFANDLEYIGTVIIPVLWLIFTIQYARYDTWFTRHWLLLFIIPAITLILVWTNSLHGWMWYDAKLSRVGEFIIYIKTYGTWFWVHTVYSYGLVLVGITILGRLLLQTRGLYRKQITILLIGIALPMFWNTIYIFKAAPTYYLDVTPPAFVVAGIIVAVGLFRFNILRIVPIALGNVFENMRDGVIILDNQDRVLNVNQAAASIIGDITSGSIGQPTSLNLANFPVLQKLVLDNEKSPAEFVINKATDPTYYEFSLIPLYDRKKQLIGKVITLHDLTERKKMELSLKDYAERITQVQEEERKRVAYELHDDTAQYLGILKMQIGALADSKEIESPKIKEKLRFLEKDADRAFNDVRRYSHELRPVVLEHQGLAAALEQIAEDYNKLGQLSVEAQIEGVEPKLSEDIKLGFFRIAQESLNNTRKYAKASQAIIHLKFEDNRIEMAVSDNGTGFDIEEASHRASGKGSLGLMSMRERAELINAELKIESELKKGTKVTLKAKL